MLPRYSFLGVRYIIPANLIPEYPERKFSTQNQSRSTPDSENFAKETERWMLTLMIIPNMISDCPFSGRPD